MDMAKEEEVTNCLQRIQEVKYSEPYNFQKIRYLQQELDRILESLEDLLDFEGSEDC
jgi:hypothetical protein